VWLPWWSTASLATRRSRWVLVRVCSPLPSGRASHGERHGLGGSSRRAADDPCEGWEGCWETVDIRDGSPGPALGLSWAFATIHHRLFASALPPRPSGPDRGRQSANPRITGGLVNHEQDKRSIPAAPSSGEAPRVPSVVPSAGGLDHSGRPLPSRSCPRSPRRTDEWPRGPSTRRAPGPGCRRPPARSRRCAGGHVGRAGPGRASGRAPWPGGAPAGRRAAGGSGTHRGTAARFGPLRRRCAASARLTVEATTTPESAPWSGRRPPAAPPRAQPDRSRPAAGR
jgi:hypothetical protein